MTVIVNPDPGYTTGDEVDQSQFQDMMQAPILAENAVDDDTTNGICVLYDYKSCKVTRQANNGATVQLIYPRNGKFVKEIKKDRVLIADKSRNLTHQKFKITDVTFADTEVTVNGVDLITYFLSQNPVRGENITGASETASYFIGNIVNHLAKPNGQINYDSDMPDVRTLTLDTSSTNALNLLLDPDAQGDKPANSVLANFGGEFVFDNYTIHHYKQAGRDRHLTYRYNSNVTSYSQEHSINNAYVGIYPFATYQPGTPQATPENVNWDIVSNTDWTSVGSVSWNAGGSIEVWDCPVKGQHVIGHFSVGQQFKVGKAINNGDMVDSLTGKQVQVTTALEHTWYPIAPEDGGGWVDGNLINFSKDGDYLVNDVIGHVTTSISSTDTQNSRYPVSGTGTVNEPGIRVFYSPDVGKGHHTTGKHLKLGTKVHYDWIDIDANGTKWYRIGPHEWLYGPHVSTDKNDDVAIYPSHGYGKVKKNSQKYLINTKTGKVTAAYHHLSLTQARKKHRKQFKTVWRGHGKHRRKHKVANPDFRKGSAIKQKVRYYNLDYGQVVIAGTLYYKLSDGSYVKASSIDEHAAKTSKPDAPDKIIQRIASNKGEINIYSAPSKGSAANRVVKVGQSFTIDHSAEGADGKTWYEITIDGKVGWIPAETTSSSAPDDLEPTTPDTSDSQDDDTATTNAADNQTVRVELPDTYDNVHNGVLYASDFYGSENSNILKLDLSSYIKHNDEDQSGLQPDGTYKATEDDIEQLYNAAVSAMSEYSIGVFPVTNTVNPAIMHGTKADLLALDLYDWVYCDFTEWDKVEKCEVTGTVWNMAGEDSSYDSITIGDPPKTLQHTLLSKAAEDTKSLASSVSDRFGRSNHIFGEIQNAMRLHNSQRISAEKDIMKQLGLVQDTTDKNGKKIEEYAVSLKTVDAMIKQLDQAQQDIKSDLLSGPGGELQFIGQDGSRDFEDPYEIRAYNGTDYLVFSGNGIGYFDAADNSVKTAMTHDGKFAADQIYTGTLKAIELEACMIKGALTVDDGTIHISIGTNKPGESPLTPTFGGNGIWEDSSDGAYHSLMSTGKFETTNGAQTWNYGADGVSYKNGNGSWVNLDLDHLKSNVKGWVGEWIHKTVTVNGKKHPIWYGA